MPPLFSSFPFFLPSQRRTLNTMTTIHPEDHKDDNGDNDNEVRISKNPTRLVGGEGLVGMGGVEKWVEGERGGMVKEEE